MYQFVDRPLASLDDGARFLVWAMRGWVAAIGTSRCPGTVIATPFARLNMLSGLQPFLRSMALLNRHGLEQMKFCSTRCTHVSEHEAILLSVACLMAEGRAAEAHASLSLIVEEEAAGDLFEAVDALTRAMGAAALSPEWPVEIARHG